jgi:hypothetical protein
MCPTLPEDGAFSLFVHHADENETSDPVRDQVNDAFAAFV